jgi:hypothetical protein
VSRRDRARARKRHAIERSRRESGPQQSSPVPKPKADTRPARSARPAATRTRPALTKGKVGDVDQRGRVRKRAMFLEPRLTVRIIFIAFVVALPGAILPVFGKTEPNLQPLTFGAFALCFAGMADLSRSWLGFITQITMAAVAVFVAVSLLLVG